MELESMFENGWGLVRASNTTPLLVTPFEAISERVSKWNIKICE